MIWQKKTAFLEAACSVYPCRAKKYGEVRTVMRRVRAGGRYKSELGWPFVTITRGWPGWPLTTRHKHGAAPRPRSHGQEGAGEPPGGALWQILQGIRRSFRYSARSQGNYETFVVTVYLHPDVCRSMMYWFMTWRWKLMTWMESLWFQSWRKWSIYTWPKLKTEVYFWILSFFCYCIAKSDLFCNKIKMF